MTPRVSFPYDPASRRKQGENPAYRFGPADRSRISSEWYAASGDLRRTDEVEVVGVDPVDLGRVRAEEAGALHRLRLHQRRHDHLGQPVLGGLGHREVDQGQLQLGADPGEEVEPGAGDLGAALGVDRPEQLAQLDVVAHRLRVVGHGADPLQHDGVVLAARPARRRRRRWGWPGARPGRPRRRRPARPRRPGRRRPAPWPGAAAPRAPRRRPSAPAWRSSSARPAARRRRTRRSAAARPRRAGRPPAPGPRRGCAARHGPAPGRLRSSLRSITPARVPVQVRRAALRP